MTRNIKSCIECDKPLFDQGKDVDVHICDKCLEEMEMIDEVDERFLEEDRQYKNDL